MRTKLQGGIGVGFDGQSHTRIRGGIIVWEDDRITYVGSRCSNFSLGRHRHSLIGRAVRPKMHSPMRCRGLNDG
jgi:hypothetical protein